MRLVGADDASGRSQSWQIRNAFSTDELAPASPLGHLDAVVFHTTRMSMHRIFFASLCLLGLASSPAAEPTSRMPLTPEQFSQVPPQARPWVWGHWLHGNINKECITRELTAMKQAGLCGMTMFDVAQPGIPAGPLDYFSRAWQEHFAFQISEAKRLGLEVMSHVGPGYSGTGGPWIKPELAAQRIYESATQVVGGKRISVVLPRPSTPENFYRDVAVLALRENDAHRGPHIEDLDMKRLVWLNYIRWKGTRSAPIKANLPKDRCIPREDVIDLSQRMKADGSLRWDAPEGEWTILRMGHGWTGQKTLPAPPAGTGPECDKLHKRGIQTHFQHVMKRMTELAGEEAGKTFHTFFMDSWEAGGQNWTQDMPAEFQRRRGYDLTPWLPVMTGRVIGDLRQSERFLFDLRLTVSELASEHFWQELHRLCRESGMRLAVQPYITTGQDLDAANHCDEPMGEFWSHPFQPNNYIATLKLASSAANLNGRLIVGAEAFTAAESERWLAHPAKLKALADEAFCLGANRLQIHRFAMQRFSQIAPGMTMGKWGQHYDRTQTWWPFVQPWHDYLARCQWLLQQGSVVTDVLVLADEEPLHRFEYQAIPGYGSDIAGPESFAQLVMKDGMPTMPSGARYRLIHVQHGGTMSLERLKKLRHLVKAGAHLLGEPPMSTPGLGGFPQADAELAEIVQELWGDGSAATRAVGQGRVHGKSAAAEVLAELKVTPSFQGPQDFRWIHRRAGDDSLFFIASRSGKSITHDCSLRAPADASVELWNPLTGAVHRLDSQREKDGTLRVSLTLEAHGSVFLLVRQTASQAPLLPTPLVTTSTMSLDGPWHLQFPPSSGVREEMILSSLRSWHDMESAAAMHFSGIAHYRHEFSLDAVPTAALLDLGRVEVMAKVKLNDIDLGIAWRPPYQCRADKALKKGKNVLEIEVVNLWPNRLIGDAALPDDARRDAQGTLLEWPKWLLQGKTSPSKRSTFVTFPLWKKDEALLPSGLLGPVQLRKNP